jgi:hypothetical protein
MKSIPFISNYNYTIFQFSQLTNIIIINFIDSKILLMIQEINGLENFINDHLNELTGDQRQG